MRTLAEKVALLHHAGTAALYGDPRSLEKAGRHLSDVARLLNNADVQAALARPDSSMEVLAADVDEWSARSGWPFTPRPAEGYGTSPAFGSEGALRDIAEKSYTDSTSLMWGQIPSFDECLEVISSQAELLVLQEGALVVKAALLEEEHGIAIKRIPFGVPVWRVVMTWTPSPSTRSCPCQAASSHT